MSDVAIALVDYGMGNRRSVEKALEHVGATVTRAGTPEAIAAADAVVIPGQGAFPEAMRRLDAQGLAAAIREAADSGTAILGICLGMQLLFDSSTEHEGASGLGLLPGTVRRLDVGELRLPQIGWNPVSWTKCTLAEGLPEQSAFYHLHSYCVDPGDSKQVLATCEYGEKFTTAAGTDRVIGVQFHPEKSSTDGLKLLDNFVNRVVRSA